MLCKILAFDWVYTYGMQTSFDRAYHDFLPTHLPSLVPATILGSSQLLIVLFLQLYSCQNIVSSQAKPVHVSRLDPFSLPKRRQRHLLARGCMHAFPEIIVFWSGMPTHGIWAPSFIYMRKNIETTIPWHSNLRERERENGYFFLFFPSHIGSH